MDYIVLTGFCIGNGVDVHPGDTVTLADFEAAPKLAANQIRVKDYAAEAPAPRKAKK